MSNTNFNYTLLQNEAGNYVLRSTVKSFNLDHVTDKDIVSFYSNFSAHASFDTGLLPLNGTGVLAIRTAGPHTQLVTQHAPGMYYINWGASEGDRNAKTYFVAQPYRIVIGDFVDGNLLGARMFYSPVPITSPNNVLYHVNLPNINCKGYRGNGVGWICLYLRDDWSSLPFNEKVVRFIERCSGVETYNDANMSETDGPRFYAQHHKPEYFWNPDAWAEHSEQNGYDWTLDENLLIPVKVTDMDNQGQHDENGQFLTLSMAMLGNYQAYYTDTNIPKMYNVISRSDINIDANNVANFITRAFSASRQEYVYTSKDNPYDFTVTHRQTKGSEVAQPTLFDEPESENDWTCDFCESTFDENDSCITTYYGQDACSDCSCNYCTYIEYHDAWFSNEDSELYWSEAQEEHFHSKFDSVFVCDSCFESYGAHGTNSSSQEELLTYIYTLPYDYTNGQEGYYTTQVCKNCYNQEFVDVLQDDHKAAMCFNCSKLTFIGPRFEGLNREISVISPNFEDPDNPAIVQAVICNDCNPKLHVCPCGFLKHSKSPTSKLNNVSPTKIQLTTKENVQKNFYVSQCCDDCVGSVSIQEFEDGMSSKYDPFNKAYIEAYVANDLHINNPLISENIMNVVANNIAKFLDSDNEPF
jgi:hypothetical protein